LQYQEKTTVWVNNTLCQSSDRSVSNGSVVINWMALSGWTELQRNRSQQTGRRYTKDVGHTVIDRTVCVIPEGLGPEDSAKDASNPQISPVSESRHIQCTARRTAFLGASEAQSVLWCPMHSIDPT
jgi:hypothetical protein